MSFDCDFSQDVQFQKLLARRSDVDLTGAALELARDAHPQLNFQTVRDWISSRAEEIHSLIVRADSDREALEILAQTIAVEHNIVGSSDAYQTASGSFLNEVIQTGRGIPISLSVLYMGVADQLGMELTGVAAPMHFLTRLETLEGPLFLDAFCGRRILTESEAVDWLHSISNVPESRIQRALSPTEPRQIIRRMLTNLKVLHARLQNWDAAWVVQNRLLALTPEQYSERRDLALVAVKSGRPGVAVRLLKSLLDSCPEDDREMLSQHLDEAGRQVAQWN